MKLLVLAAVSALQIVWSGTASALSMTCAQAESQEIKSLRGDTPVSVHFQNNRISSVDIYWINYDRRPVFYKTLGTAENYIQQTFMTHPWIFFEAGSMSDCLGVYLPDGAQNTHLIR